MKPMDGAARKTLRLADAVQAEAGSARSWLPEDPYWTELTAAAHSLASTLGARLAKGYSPSRQLVVNMRKNGFGMRPLAVWSPLDRIVYRALTDRILEDVPELDQSGGAYLAFINGPITYAMGRRAHPSRVPLGWRLDDTDIGYVVKTDVTAFYQYIDHARLAEQLLLLTDDYIQIDALMEMLGEVQGRAYGLPQMLHSSDRLADVYIQAVERALTREGWLVSRFNDDFRIACVNYSDALRAIERFAAAAHDIGLVANESKTAIVRLNTYILFETPMQTSDGGDGVAVMDTGMSPDEFISDYTDAVSGDNDPSDALNITSAVFIGARTQRPPHRADPFKVEPDPINVAEPSVAEIRSLRRALNKLARLSVQGAAHQIPLLIGYIPSLTPNAVRYLASLPENSDQVLLDVIDQIVEQPLNTWQQVWLLSLIRARYERFDEAPSAVTRRWVEATLQGSRDHMVRAEAALSAAVIGATTSTAIDLALNEAPAAVAPWYVLALRHLPADDKMLRAVSNSDALFRWLLPQSAH